MLNKNDFKYILKRVIVFLIIGFVIAFLGSCNAKADSFIPFQTALVLNNNSVLTNTNMEYTYQLCNSDDCIPVRELFDTNRTVSEINRFDIGLKSGAPFSTPETYYKFDLFITGSNVFNANGQPNIDIDSVKMNNKLQTGVTYDCDINAGVFFYNTENPSKSYIQTHIRCLGTASNGIWVYVKKYNPNDNLNPLIQINLMMSYTGFYTTDLTNADMIQEISDTRQSIINQTIWQQQTEINQQQFNETFNDLNNSNINNSVISQLILLPISFLQSFLAGFNSTCVNYNFGSLLGTDLILPCLNLQQKLGQNLWNIIDWICSGMLIFAISKKFVNIFDDLTNLRTNQIDELYGGGA